MNTRRQVAAGIGIVLALPHVLGCATGATARERLEAERAAVLARVAPAPGRTAPHLALVVPEDGLASLVAARLGAEAEEGNQRELVDFLGVRAAMRHTLRPGVTSIRLDARCEGCLAVRQEVNGTVELTFEGLLPLLPATARLGFRADVAGTFAVSAVLDDEAVVLRLAEHGEPLDVRVTIEAGGVRLPIPADLLRERLVPAARRALEAEPGAAARLPRSLPAMPGVRVTGARVRSLSRPGPALALLLWTDAAPERPPALDVATVAPGPGLATLVVDEAALEAALQRATAADPAESAKGAVRVLLRSLRFEPDEAVVGGRGYLLPGRGAVWNGEARIGASIEGDEVRFFTRGIEVWPEAPKAGLPRPGPAEIESWRERVSPRVRRDLLLGGDRSPRLRVESVRFERERLVLDVSLST